MNIANLNVMFTSDNMHWKLKKYVTDILKLNYCIIRSVNHLCTAKQNYDDTDALIIAYVVKRTFTPIGVRKKSRIWLN